jgi:hypothetical protein
MAILTAVYVVATLWIAYLSHKNNINLKELERERVRPYIVCEFFFWDFHINFAVSNNGATMAKNIKLQFDKPFHRFIPNRESIAFVENPIGSLVPGGQLKTYLGDFKNFLKEYPNGKIVCTVSYQSIFGNTYQDIFLLDVGYQETNISLEPKTIENVANSLDKIENNLGHIVSGFKKIHILTQNIEQYRDEQRNNFAQSDNVIPSQDDNTNSI